MWSVFEVTGLTSHLQSENLLLSKQARADGKKAEAGISLVLNQHQVGLEDAQKSGGDGVKMRGNEGKSRGVDEAVERRAISLLILSL